MLKDAESKMCITKAQTREGVGRRHGRARLHGRKHLQTHFVPGWGTCTPNANAWRFAPRLSSANFWQPPGLAEQAENMQGTWQSKGLETFQAVRKRIPDTYSDSNECLLFCNLAVLRHSLAQSASQI